MSTAVASVKPINQAVASKVTNEEIQRMIALDQMVKGFRSELENPEIGEMTRMLIQARAITALEESITAEMMVDVEKLMNNPLGFKTDKPKVGDKYDLETIKRCLIVAWLMGAKATGNEFNIIAGNCYLTKEYSRPAILRFNGLTHFEEQIGAPMQHGDKTAICEAIATWQLHGRPQELRCVKTDSMDARIVVNRYSTSSPDEIRGKVQAKLYQRVLARLTGINLNPDDRSGDASDTIDATPRNTRSEATPPMEIEHVESEAGDQATADQIVQDAANDISGLQTVNDVNRYRSDRLALLKTAEWSNELKQTSFNRIHAAADGRIAEIRSQRGK
jgi:hypothetical protein